MVTLVALFLLLGVRLKLVILPELVERLTHGTLR